MITLEKINDKQVKISGDTAYVITHSTFFAATLLVFFYKRFFLFVK